MDRSSASGEVGKRHAPGRHRPADGGSVVALDVAAFSPAVLVAAGSASSAATDVSPGPTGSVAGDHENADLPRPDDLQKLLGAVLRPPSCASHQIFQS